MNSGYTFTVLSTGHTSAYPCHYARRLLLVPSRPLKACGWLPARRLTSGESRQRVTPFRVSIFRDRRVVLYAGSRSSEYHVSAWQHGRRPVPFWACHSAVGQGLHDDASTAPLLIVTHNHLLDGSLRSARGLPPFLPAFDAGLPVPRRGRVLSPIHRGGES